MVAGAFTSSMAKGFQVKRVTFSTLVEKKILEQGPEWKIYRKPFWFFVSLDRKRIEGEISKVLTNEHREKIANRNGVNLQSGRP